MNSDVKRNMDRIGVVGAGTMGAAIAQHFLMKGLPVVLLDVNQQGLDRGLQNIDGSLQEAVERRILSVQDKSELLGRLNRSTDYRDLTNCDLVVEAVFEDMAIKQQVFEQVEAQVSDHCIIASNTSSFSLTQLGSVLKNRSRFLGVHYFYHAAKNKLIEIIPGDETGAKTVEDLVNFYYSIDKSPIVVADVDGFAVNRFFVPWLNEATRLWEEGEGSIAFIDEVAREVFNIGMGPFALMNATGIPIALHSANTLANRFGPMYAPSASLIKQVETGQEWDCESTETPCNNRDLISERLLAMSLGVAAQLVSEGVATVTDTDLGARLGLRWPQGPFEIINRLGVSRVRKMVSEAFKPWQEKVPELLQQADPEQGFDVQHVKGHVIGQVGVIEFNRPDAMNALNPAVVVSLARVFDELDQNPSVEKIILFGRGKAFVAGADIKFFVDNIERKDLQFTYDFTVLGQNLLSRIARSSKRTIAYLDGLALGGGLELALACDHRIATDRLAVAFPETGIGIYPGLGGTQRTPRLIGLGLAKFMVATGAMLNVDQALAYGLVDCISDSKTNLPEIASLEPVKSDSKTQETDVVEQGFAAFNGELTEELFSNPLFAKYEKLLRKKAPVALREAMRMIDEGSDIPLEKALQLELDGLFDIFSTRDAYAGLSGIITGKPAAFCGE